MDKNLRDLAENDIEKILDNKEIFNKNFFILILHFLLENKSIDLIEVGNLSEELTKHYNEFLNYFELELVESNGEIINVLQNALRKFQARIHPILDKIKKIKENGRS